MTVAGWVVLMAALMSLGFTVGHNHSGETDTYHVSVGHLFLLRCLFADAHTNVTWSREGRHDQSLPTGVEVRDGLLWFLPVQVSHNGSYTCEKRGTTGLSRMTFGVSVSNKECPDPPETISIIRGVNEGLPCKQKEIFRLKNTRKIRWMKECHPVEGQRKRVFVDENGLMRLSTASEQDAGTYTCLVDINLDGKMYTAARSIQLNIKNNTFIAKPEVMFPKGKVVVVEVDTPTGAIGQSDGSNQLSPGRPAPTLCCSWQYGERCRRVNNEPEVLCAFGLPQFFTLVKVREIGALLWGISSIWPHVRLPATDIKGTLEHYGIHPQSLELAKAGGYCSVHHSLLATFGLG
uniref:Type I interleukin-1 receptor n=1 Tax=Epinephelus coioides TaxID=94232 RepID=R4R1I4_EPICO|nr:type I interleukin-1 receptor [Epinephelus coioides]